MGIFRWEISKPSMVDVSAFPMVSNGYVMGMHGKTFLLDHPEINAWAQLVSAHLPDNPLLEPDKFIERKLAE